MDGKNDTGERKKKVILGLVGSPRRLGNCEVLVKEIWKNVETEYSLKLIRMPSLDIRPCDACYACVMGKACPKEDDMGFLLDRLAESDGFIIASPVYFLGAHSIYKRILDRGFLLYNILERTYGKPCILLNLYGMGKRLGAAPHTLMTLASFLGLKIKTNVNVKAALPGEVLLKGNVVSKTRKWANDLFSEEKKRRGTGCPFCGCSIVRMERKGFVCALCHGNFKLDHSGTVVKMKEGDIFGTPEHMLLHKTWLTGMKQEFLKRRKEILKTTLSYKDMGKWLEP